MKKKIALLLSAVLALSVLAGCGNKNTAQTTETKPSETKTEPPVAQTQQAAAYSADGSVIFDKDGVRVTTAGLDNDPTTEDAEPIIWVDIENTGAQDAYLGVSSGSVNGVVSEVRLIEFYMEDGTCCGGNYETQLTIPAASSGRYALGYYSSGVPGIDLSTLGELEFCFTTAKDESSWPNYTSEPVTIVTGEAVPAVDVASLGKVVVDNDTLTLVLGEQDYDDWFGPMVYAFMLNKSDQFIGVYADSAEVDGVLCDYLLGGLAAVPGKAAAAVFSFDGEARELKGFENLTLNLSVCKAKDLDSLNTATGTALDPIVMTYPPRIWGEYENGGLSMAIQPKYNDLITVETPANDTNGILFSVSETASREAGSFEGAGWLFDVARISEEKLHELLCYDMSGVEVFAKDEDGSCYVYYHPTDVRYERATAEEMERDAAQWSMLCEWAEGMKDKLAEQNGLERVYYGNSDIDICLARAAYMDGVNYTLSTTEYGPVAGGGVNGAPYAEFVMRGFFTMTEDEAPDGEYVVLSLPDEDVRIDFFTAPGAYARVVAGGQETMYQAAWWDDDVSYADAMRGWYYAAAEKTGVKPVDESLKAYLGSWAEKIAGRGYVVIEKSVAPGKARITASWPDGAAVMNTWEMTATLEDGRLAYENGHWEVREYGENDEERTTDESYEESGYFYLNDAGELCWHNERVDSEDSVFVRAS